MTGKAVTVSMAAMNRVKLAFEGASPVSKKGTNAFA